MPEPRADRDIVSRFATDTLAALWSSPSPEIWTAIEITGTTANPGITAVCAISRADRPAPIANLTALNGRIGPRSTR
jgi:hypothetical protein